MIQPVLLPSFLLFFFYVLIWISPSVPTVSAALLDLNSSSSSSSSSAGLTVSSSTLFSNSPTSSVELLFQPPFLDFAETPVCTPTFAEVDVTNRNPLSSLQIYSIQASSPYFFPNSPQFELKPLQTLSLQIVFLPHFLGKVNATIYLLTNLGNFSYFVRGIGVNSLYDVETIDIQRFYGDDIPEQQIIVFNPHHGDMLVSEIFTTDPFINLLYDNSNNNNNNNADKVFEDVNINNRDSVWLVSSNTSKTIMSFSIAKELLITGINRGYIHIHTDHDRIIIPVIVEMLGSGIKYRELSFGMVLATTEKKVVDVVIDNESDSQLMLFSISANPPDPRLKIEMLKKAISIPSHSKLVKVASLTYTSNTVGPFLGSIELHFNNGRENITYGGYVFSGKIAYNESLTTFRIQSSSAHSDGLIRIIPLKNNFPVPLKILHIGLSNCADIIQVDQYLIGQIFLPNETSNPLIIQIPSASIAAIRHYRITPRTCWLELVTNITTQRVPLHLIEGKLSLDLIEGVS